MGTSKRVAFFDELRGLTVLSMIAFHTCYDLVYIFGLDVHFFADLAIQEIWRCSISWTFIALAGWMTQFSRNNFKRGCIYASGALIIWLATTIVRVDTPVSFGILYCMAACTFVYVAIEQSLEKLNPRGVIAISLILFLLMYRVPKTTYSIEGLAWLGLPSPVFTSGDYYPLIPFVFLYITGATASSWFKKSRHAYPAWMLNSHAFVLDFIGKHSLVIYLLHQPLVLGALTILIG